MISQGDENPAISLDVPAKWMMITVMLVAAFVVIGLDQYSKFLVVQLLSEEEVVSVIPKFFNVTLVYNPGVAFGMMAELPDHIRQFALAGTTLLAFAAIVYFLLKDYYHDLVAQSALAMIIGGAVGNIIDRVRLGRVIDFLDVYYQTYHWPAFNIADSAICVGVAILLIRKPASTALKELRGKIESASSEKLSQK